MLVRPDVRRGKLLELVAHLPPCLIACEDAANSHTGGGQTRLSVCGTRWMVTTLAQWGVAERFVSGVDFNKLNQQTRLWMSSLLSV